MDEDESVEALRTDLFTILSMLGQKTFTMQAYFELMRGEVQQFCCRRRVGYNNFGA